MLRRRISRARRHSVFDLGETIFRWTAIALIVAFYVLRALEFGTRERPYDPEPFDFRNPVSAPSELDPSDSDSVR